MQHRVMSATPRDAIVVPSGLHAPDTIIGWADLWRRGYPSLRTDTWYPARPANHGIDGLWLEATAWLV